MQFDSKRHHFEQIRVKKNSVLLKISPHTSHLFWVDFSVYLPWTGNSYISDRSLYLQHFCILFVLYNIIQEIDQPVSETLTTVQACAAGGGQGGIKNVYFLLTPEVITIFHICYGVFHEEAEPGRPAYLPVSQPRGLFEATDKLRF